MQRRHFELMARTILDFETDGATRNRLAADFARMLRLTNERFDEKRFLTAATGKPNV